MLCEFKLFNNKKNIYIYFKMNQKIKDDREA